MNPSTSTSQQRETKINTRFRDSSSSLRSSTLGTIGIVSSSSVKMTDENHDAQQQQSRNAAAAEEPSLQDFVSQQLFCSWLGTDVCFELAPSDSTVLDGSEHVLSESGISEESSENGEGAAAADASAAKAALQPNPLELIPAHKIILARSPVFRTMFFGETASQMSEQQTQSGITRIQENMSRDALLLMLKFMYTDQVTDLNESNVLEIFHVARKYSLGRLEAHCVSFLKDVLALDNCFLLYQQARLFQSLELEQRCIRFIEKNAQILLTQFVSSFCELSYEDVLLFARDDFLQIDSESVLFDALLAWADAECKRREIDSKINENKRLVLSDAFFDVRFVRMEQREFATRIVASGLLSHEEIIDIFCWWALNGQHEGTPFNTKPRRKREYSFLVIGSGQTNRDIEQVRQHLLEAARVSSPHGDDLSCVEIFNARLQLPSLEFLKRFHSILVFSEQPFYSGGGSSGGERLGDLLADYVDAGGAVTIATFALCSNSLQLKGRIMDQQGRYLPVSFGPQKNLAAGQPHWAHFITHQDAHLHPILRGINRIDCGKYRARCELHDEALCLAEWEDGVPLVALNTRTKCACLNMYPASSNVYTDCWNSETDGAQLLFNIMTFVAEQEGGSGSSVGEVESTGA